MTAGAGYAEQVERAFLRRVGRGLMLSPRDLDLVTRWERAGLPVEVVIAGIDRAFDGRPEGARPVRSLSFVAGAVDDAAKAWRERGVGRAGREPGAGGLAPAFDRLLQDIEETNRMVADPELRAAVREAWRAVRELADRAVAGDERDPADALRRIDEGLVERAVKTLDAETRRHLEAQVDAALASLWALGDPSALAEARRVRFHRAAREALALPALRLDFGEVR